MEFALVLRELSRRRLLLAVGVLIAAIAAIFSVYRLDGTTLKSRSLQYSSASTQLLVDSPSSALGSLSQAFEPLSARAVVYANFMASPAVLNLIGQQAGIPGNQIYAAGPVNANLPRVEQEPTALKRNVEITGETVPYRLNFNSEPNLPTVSVDAQAPTTGQAVALANGAVIGLQRYVTSLEQANGVPPHSRVAIRQLGSANGGVVNGGISKTLALTVFLVVFLLWCVLVLVAVRFRENWRTSATVVGAHMPASERDDGSGEALGNKGDDGSSEALGKGGDAPTARPRGRAHSPEADPFETLAAAEDDRTRVPTQSTR